MAFDGRGPAAYVDFLTQQGLLTSLGAIKLRAYVSGSARSPMAAALGRLFNALLNDFSDSTLDTTPSGTRRRPHAFDPRRWSGDLPVGLGDPLAAGLNRLETMRESIRAAGGRPSAWRSVFSGQGMPADIAQVMDFIAQEAPLMLAACGSNHALRPYFSSGAPTLAGIQQMVDDEVFGLDCLGFVGTYLAWCGAEPRYPRLSQAQYESILNWRRVSTVAEVEDRCALLWLTTSVNHIAIIDRVVSRDGANAITIDLCQSSRGGPQTNRNVELSRVDLHTPTSQYFRITGGDDPWPVPVSGREIIVIKRPSW